ncbi:hypothetical protein NM208_g8207 [Fusarium decemcellulare]|uniref:Uncharacterized protein n=1 Tax=Fusarium decemcellulare TaxID=57161 RepID=A0ACC1S695_9HYPO|nr:hypothetical protein NM208_g8207 [Fusarium decemcellulare]
MSSTKGLALVTGANGFIGARTVEAFLSANYSVRAVVRSQNVSLQPTLHITAPGAFDDAIKDVTAVAHLATPVDFTNTDVEYVIRSAVQGTLGILNSAINEPGLKAFVYMSSIVAVRGRGPKYQGRAVTEEDWNDEAEETLAEAGAEVTGHQIYAASKVKAERAFWDFRAKNASKISFSMTAINPAWVAGPPLIMPEDPEKLSDTAIIAYRVMMGQEVPPVGPGNGTHVDVRDVARLVVFAAENSKVADGQRYLAGGNGNFANIQAYRDILLRAYPDRKSIIGAGEPGKGYLEGYAEPPDARRIDARKAAKATGQDWIPFEKTVLDAAKRYERYM